MHNITQYGWWYPKECISSLLFTSLSLTLHSLCLLHSYEGMWRALAAAKREWTLSKLLSITSDMWSSDLSGSDLSSCDLSLFSFYILISLLLIFPCLLIFSAASWTALFFYWVFISLMRNLLFNLMLLFISAFITL